MTSLKNNPLLAVLLLVLALAALAFSLYWTFGRGGAISTPTSPFEGMKQPPTAPAPSGETQQPKEQAPMAF